MQDADRRTSDRVEHSSRVLHREYVLRTNKPSYEETSLQDISSDGLSFTTGRDYKKGDMLEVRLMLSGWDRYRTEFYLGDPRRATDPLVALVEVMSVNADSPGNNKIGVRFSSIDEWHRDALKRYLEKFRRTPS